MNAEPHAYVRGRLLVDGDIVAGTLTIADGRIVGLEADPSASDGPYVAPGFVDLHVHGYGGHDAMGGENALDGMARALLRRGVTSFLPTAVTASLAALDAFTAQVRGWLAHAPDDGAAPLGFNLEGPFISPQRPGAQNPAHIVEPAGVPADRLHPWLDSWRMTTVAPEVPGALALIGWLRDRGVVVSLGHSAATAALARAGYAAGATTTTHLFDAMTGIDHRAPGLALAALLEDDAAVELIADGQHVHPDVWPLILRTKPAHRVVLVSDALPVAGTSARRATVGGLDVQVRGGRCTLAGTDTLAGSVIALDDAVRNVVGTGVPIARAVATVTTAPLALLGIADRGRLAVGQRADLVELDDTLAVRGAWRQGRRVD